ncbi:MBG domain-containing protein, partial [Faecalicoccus pleomorphus]
VNVTGTAVVRDADNNDVTAQFSVKTQDGKLTITPADVTITVEDDSKIYGQADPEFAEPDVVGLVNEKDLGEITVIRTNSEVETVGNYQDVLDAQYTPNPNYTVEVIKGDFEIKAQSINPSDPSYLNVKVNKPENKVYDGKDHKWIPEVTLEDGTPLVEGTDYTVTYSTENFKDVQKIKVTIEGTGNYSGTVTRKYRITRKPITVTTDSAIKVYDGSALTADGRVEGIVDGETYGFVITGTQTEVGSSKNTYKIEWTGSAKEGNYTIDKDLGTLTVVPQSIDPEDPTKPEDPDQPVYAGIKVDKPEDKVYDGQEHKWTPTVTLSDGTVLDPENYEVSYDTQDFVNVTGKITVTITGTGNYAGTVTREYQITPRAVTITSADDSKVYDGTPLTNGNVSVTQGSLVSEEDITFKATGSQTEVGSSANTIEVTYANEQMEKNYKVTLDEGTLTVTEKPAGSDSDKDSESADGEDTATATNVGIFASLATSALAGLGILTALKKKRKD